MIIIDTNVLVSGLLTGNPQAPTARILDAILGGQVRCLLSPELLDEYRTVLLRPAIAKRHGLGTGEIDELLVAIVQNSVWREPGSAQVSPPDPRDEHLWALLEMEPAAQLVTGDGPLLENPISESRLTTPAAYTASWGD